MRPSRLLAAIGGLALQATAIAAQGRAATDAARTASAAPLARPAAVNWLSDRRELAVGDVITLYVDDAVLASARKSQSGRDDTRRDLSVGVSPPAGAEPISAAFGDSRRASSEQSGDMNRSTAFRTTIAVRVVARTPEGGYQVKGLRRLDLDKNRQEIAVEGVLRPQDVSVDNSADGDRLADARITVKQRGRLGRTRGGIVGRILGLVWP